MLYFNIMHADTSVFVRTSPRSVPTPKPKHNSNEKSSLKTLILQPKCPHAASKMHKKVFWFWYSGSLALSLFLTCADPWTSIFTRVFIDIMHGLTLPLPLPLPLLLPLPLILILTSTLNPHFNRLVIEESSLPKERVLTLLVERGFRYSHTHYALDYLHRSCCSFRTSLWNVVWSRRSGSRSPAAFLWRALAVPAGKSLQNLCPPLFSPSMKKKISLPCSLPHTAKHHPDLPATPLHNISPPVRPPKPSLQTGLNCVKLDPKFEKCYREVQL